MVGSLLSKIVTVLISPLGTALALLLIGTALLLLGRKRLVALASIFAGTAWLWLWSLPVVSAWLVHSGEQAFPPARAEAAPVADAIVVLGGAMASPPPGFPYPDMSAAADRPWHAARLYRAGKAPIVVASGGSDMESTSMPEAQALRMLLSELGVPDRAIVVEGRSRNTRENAEFTAAVLRERNVHRILLVTSALHMRRAVMEFEEAGLRVFPAAADHSHPAAPGISGWLPNAEALDASGRAMKEWIGVWSQRVRITFRQTSDNQQYFGALRARNKLEVPGYNGVIRMPPQIRPTL